MISVVSLVKEVTLRFLRVLDMNIFNIWWDAFHKQHVEDTTGFLQSPRHVRQKL